MLFNKVLLRSKSYLQDLKLIYTVFILKLDLKTISCAFRVYFTNVKFACSSKRIFAGLM